jgi:hypothetical protein
MLFTKCCKTIFVENITVFLVFLFTYIGRDSVVGIATRYGLGARGSNPSEARFSGPIQHPVQWVPGPFPVGKAAEEWR